jgi:GT2 family glycosyltransferase
MKMKASIVIIHFSNVDYTADCVTSVLKAKCSYDYEILIIDNANKKNDVIKLKKLLAGHDNISIRTNLSTNTGFSNGIKLGLAHAKYDYLVVLDNDTIVEDYWLDGMMDCFKTNKNTGIATAQIFSPDSTKSILGGKVNMFGFSYSHTIEKNDSLQKNDQNIFYGITAWTIKKDILEKVHIDTNFQFFSDDADIGYKVKSLGYNVSPALSSRVTHLKAGKDKVMKQETVNFKVKICNRDYWVFSYIHLPIIHFVIFFITLLLFKLAFLPIRIIRGDRSIPYDFIGFLLFITMPHLQARKQERQKLRTISYWQLLKHYSWRLYLGTMIFK